MANLSKFNTKIPSIVDLQKRAKARMPKFAYEYLIGGCFDDVGLQQNYEDLRSVRLSPKYLKPFDKASMKTTLLGKEYDAPFGIAPIGLQGLMWPNSPVILAKAAKKHNIPYVISTMSSESLEVIADIAQDNAWYQLYNPTDGQIRQNILKRLKQAGYKNIMVTVDVPTFGYRPRDMRNGLSMPPQKNMKTFLEAALRPQWSLKTLKYGIPDFKNLQPYMDKSNKLELVDFMNKMCMGGVHSDALKEIRDLWDGNLIIKGVTDEDDVEKSIELGAQAVVVSNHGARQLDASPSSISVLPNIKEKYGEKINILMDSGLRSGVDVAAALASGAHFCFLGRYFMYSVAALGDEGGDHAIAMLKTQLNQVMNQLRAKDVAALADCIIK